MKSGVARAVVVLLGAVLAGGVSTMGAQAPAGDCRVIDDFGKAAVGEFPSDWKVRKDAGKEVYVVKEEDGKRFLHAYAKNLGIQAAKEYEWDLKAYPVLAWSWRPVEFPRGADEKAASWRNLATTWRRALCLGGTLRRPSAGPHGDPPPPPRRRGVLRPDRRLAARPRPGALRSYRGHRSS